MTFVWLPFTQMSSFDPGQRTFVKAVGTQLVDSRDRWTFDAISSVWTTIHGHCHPYITEAIARQARELDHATALGATNPVAEELAERLCSLTSLPRTFFAGDGASAIEAALKIALQYWQNIGEPQRNRFVHLRSSYHGDTVGAMSVSDIPVFRDRFDSLCFESLRYDAVDDVIARPDVAAIIVEPRVQAAAGMHVVAPEAYGPLRPGITPLVIADEIATGFGRTGTLFAFTALGLSPDLICLGKGLTGGTLALSATLATQRVYDAFLSASPTDLRHFFHGHSYAANPIACAAAIASLDVFEIEHTLENVTRLTAHLTTLTAQLRDNRRIRDVRSVGLMCGIELEADLLPETSRFPTPAWNVADRMYERGHFTRPIGNVIQLVPPLTSSPRELDLFVESLAEAIR